MMWRFSSIRRRICPKCGVAMAPKDLTEYVTVDMCRQCRGMWLDHGELKQLVEARMSERSSPRDIGGADRTQLHCPDCDEPLFERQFERRSDVRIDQCRLCAGIFLDLGELDRIKEFLGGLGGRRRDDTEH